MATDYLKVKDIMKHFLNKIFQALWVMLPDKCEMPGCKRQGVRGNENIIDGKICCDYCHAKQDNRGKQ